MNKEDQFDIENAKIARNTKSPNLFQRHLATDGPGVGWLRF